MDAIQEYENRVAKDFDFAYGREPQGLSRDNVQWGAQHVALADKMDVPYLGNLTAVPGVEQPCWYAGAVCLSCHTFNPATGGEVEATPQHRILDINYSNDDACYKRFEIMKRYINECAERKVEFMTIFGSHPSKFLSRGFLESRILAGGKNHSVQEVGFLYGALDADAEERAKKNFRKVCEFIRNHPALECKGISEVAKDFSTQPKDITRDEMTAYAEDMVRGNKILLHRTFSPAELLMGMMESLALAGDSDDLPNGVDRRNILGPVDIPTIGLEMPSISYSRLLKLCRKAAEHVEDTGHLPGNVYLKEERLGIGQLAITVSRAYAAQTRYSRYATLNLDAKVRYPEVAFNVDACVRHKVHEHTRFDPDLSNEKIAKHARLQTWTLKPAWLSPPRGKSCHEGRIPVGQSN